MEDSTCFLPYDILVCIFIRLQVRCLLRFLSVSKLWKAIIHDKVFMTSYLDRSKVWSRENLLVQMDDGVFEIRELESPEIAMEKQQFPLQRFRHATALCSYDGLVLLKTRMAYKTYALWNPYNRKYRSFTCPYVKAYSCKTPHACGLGYDSSVGDYKVIFIYKSFYTVYYVNMNYWTKKESVNSKLQTLNSRPIMECSPGISTRGCVFWSLGSKIDQLVSTNSTIIYFDVASDELKELPKLDFSVNNPLFRLTSLKGSLGLYGGDEYSKLVNIWIMKQDGWKFLMRIIFNNIRTSCGRFVEESMMLGCTRNGEILFQGGVGLHYFIMYDPKRRKFKAVKISESFDLTKRPTIPVCLESLNFLKPNTMRKRKRAILPD